MADTKFKIRKGSSKGCGFISWQRLEKVFRRGGEFTEQDALHSVSVDKEGISYSTKKRKQK